MGNFDPKSIRDGKAWCDVVNKRTTFRVGDRVQVCGGSGLDSYKIGTVIPMFDWRKASDGSYKAPGTDQVPIKYDDGGSGFMFKNRLKHVEGK